MGIYTCKQERNSDKLANKKGKRKKNCDRIQTNVIRRYLVTIPVESRGCFTVLSVMYCDSVALATNINIENRWKDRALKLK